MTMKILSPFEQQNIQQGRQQKSVTEAICSLAQTIKANEQAYALDWLPEERNDMSDAVKYAHVVQMAAYKMVGIEGWLPRPIQNPKPIDRTPKPAEKPRYTGNDLEQEAMIARLMTNQDNLRNRDKLMEWVQKENEAFDGYFHPTSLSTFVQDHRIMRKGPWK